MSFEAVTIHTEVDVFVGSLDAGQTLGYRLTRGYAWIQIIKGEISLNGTAARGGDGVAVSEEEHLDLAAKEASEFLLFDL